MVPGSYLRVQMPACGVLVALLQLVAKRYRPSQLWSAVLRVLPSNLAVTAECRILLPW